MSNISGQLIKDTFNYVLQSDLTTGVVYRIGGDIPINPIFSSGLTINASFRYQDGSESNGYVLTSDSSGNATWKEISGFTTISIFDSYTSNTQNILSEKVNKSGDTITGQLNVQTLSADTYLNLPLDVYVTGGTYTNGNIIFRNNAGGSFGVTGLPIGGAGGQVYYLNLSQNQNGYKEFSPIATTQPQESTGVTINGNSTTTIASFLTPVGYPNVNLIPAGIWSFYLHSYKEDNNAEFNVYCEVYKITTGGTETLLLTTDPAIVTGISPNPTMEITDGYYSGSSVDVSDRIVVKLLATNITNQSHTITFFTEGSQYYSYGVTPFTNNSTLTCDNLSGCSIINDILVDLTQKIEYYYQNTPPTGNIIVGSIWVHSETGVEYIYNYDGNSYQWVQQTLPVGPQGPQGANGTNNIDSGTTTTLNGVLIGNGVVVTTSSISNILGYTPENVANKETVALDSSNLKYPTNNVVTTALQSFSDDVDYVTMINQRILFNY